MGWYLRKSFSAGPIRLNLSKSGLGTSFGIKGARVGINSKGTYIHAGRGGIYYRSSLGTSKSNGNQPSDLNQKINHESEQTASAPYYNNVQIFEKKAALILDLKRKKKFDWMAYTGIIVFGFLSVLFWGPKNLTTQTTDFFGSHTRDISILSFIISIGILYLFFSGIVTFYLRKWKADKLYRLVKSNCLISTSQDAIVNIPKIIEQLTQSTVKGEFLDYVKVRLFKDYLVNTISNLNVSSAEAQSILELEKVLELEDQLTHTIKRWIFNVVYSMAIEDREIAEFEEKELFNIQKILGLTNEDIVSELDSIRKLIQARQIQQGAVTQIDLGIPLQKGEVGYFKSSGRIVKDKVLRSYQRDGQRHSITGAVVDREGELFLTNKRIILVGEGSQSIKLDKIFNISSDIDQNLISLDLDGRKTPLQITTPDTLIFSALLNRFAGQTEKLI